MATVTRKGPDEVESYMEFDRVNRLTYFRRGPENNPVMEASYTYYANDRLMSVKYGPAAPEVYAPSVHYTYDDANRVTSITHKNADGDVILALAYTYSKHNLPLSITETSASYPYGLAVTTFMYDNRGRLIEEERTGAVSPYHLKYEYDLGGNRTKKTKLDNGQKEEVRYYYDIGDPNSYESNNNRLMKAETWDVTLSDELNHVHLHTKWYFYTCAGNVSRVVSRDEPTGGAMFLMGGGGGEEESLESLGEGESLESEASEAEPLGEGGGESQMLLGGNGCFEENHVRYNSVWFTYAANGEAVTFVAGERK